MKKNKIFVFILIICVFLINREINSANIPEILSFQGKITSSSGISVNDTIPIVFKIYDVSAGGSALWIENQTLAVIDGIFNAELGSITTLNLTFDKQYWIGISVNGDAEMIPREKIKTSAYSFNSILSDTANNVLFVNVIGDTVTKNYVDSQILSLGTKTNIINLSDSVVGILSPDSVAKIQVTNIADSYIRNYMNGNLAGSLNISGKVGIGTTAPSDSLTIAGTLRADSGIFRDTVIASHFIGNGSRITGITFSGIEAGAVNSGHIADNEISNIDVAATAAIAPSKIDTTAIRLGNNQILSGISALKIDTTLMRITTNQIIDGEIINSDISSAANISSLKLDTALLRIQNSNVLAAIDAVKIGGGAVDNTEYSYLDGVTSALQTQMNTKSPSASPTFTGNVTMPGTGIWNSSGYVGIGTSSPSAKLEILDSNSSYTLSLKNTNSAGQAGYLSLNDQNNWLKFTKVGSAVAGTLFGINEAGNSSLYSNSGDLLIGNANGNIYLGNTGASGIPRLTIASTGKIGIGTNSPSDSLQVNGSIKAETMTITNFVYANKFYGDGSSLTNISVLNSSSITGGNILNGTISDADIGNTAAISALKIDTTLLRIQNSNVLPAIDAVKIGGGAVDNTEYGYLDGITSSLQNQLNAKSPGASPTFTGNVTMPGTGIWNSSGNVGIGTSSPAGKVHIYGGNLVVSEQAQYSTRSAYSLYTDSINPWSDYGLRIYDGNSTNHLTIDNFGPTQIQSYGNGNPAAAEPASYTDIYLNPVGGNVGVGTSTVSYKLDVNGDLNLRTSARY